MFFPQSSFAPKIWVSRDRFGRPGPRQSAVILYAQADWYLWFAVNFVVLELFPLFLLYYTFFFPPFFGEASTCGSHTHYM